jgi:hypothetical protein
MKNNKLLLVVGLGCAGVVGLILVASCAGVMLLGIRSASSANGELSATIDDLLRAAAKGSFAETYQSATTPEFRQATSAANYTKLGELIKTQLGACQSKQLVRVNLRQVNASSFAEVAYQGTFERGAGTIRATLKRSGTRWLLVAFHLDSPSLFNDLPDQACSKCRGKYASSAKFCPHCGEAVRMK